MPPCDDTYFLAEIGFASEKRKALTIHPDDFRKHLMETASCSHITLLEESMLHWVRASLSVRKSSPKHTFFLDFWLHAVSAPDVSYANDGISNSVCNNVGKGSM